MVDVSGTAGTVFGIAGMGIGLGLLAHTASNIARSTDRMYDRQGYGQGQGFGRGRESLRRGYGLKDTSQRGRREGGLGRNRVSTCRYPREEPREESRQKRSFGSGFGSAPRRSFGSGFGSSSFRFNPQPMSLTKPTRSFRW